MPEGLEIELYRRAAEATVGRTISQVHLSHPDYARGGVAAEHLHHVLDAQVITEVRRIGKLLLVDTPAATLGLRFGMTGRLIVDDSAIIEELEYASKANNPAWDRFRLDFADQGYLAIRDQRRLGSVELHPDESALGIDIFDLDANNLGVVLAGSSRALKSRLLDQGQVAGLGNLLCDEILWRAGIHPTRASNSLGPAEQARLLASIQRVLPELLDKGGSHMGDLQEQRHRGGICPLDSTPLGRHTVGGRTTYACPEHQR